MQLTHKMSGVSLIAFAVFAFSGFFVAANADETTYTTTSWNGDSSCEIRHESWDKGNGENWSNDGWRWDAEFSYWEHCSDSDSDKSHNNRDEWKDDNNDGRCDWDGKDWDTWQRDHGKNDWNNGNNDHKDWNDDWGKDDHNDWNHDDKNWDGKDGRDGKDGKDGKNGGYDWDKHSRGDSHASVRSYISANALSFIRI